MFPVQVVQLILLLLLQLILPPLLQLILLLLQLILLLLQLILLLLQVILHLLQLILLLLLRQIHLLLHHPPSVPIVRPAGLSLKEIVTNISQRKRIGNLQENNVFRRR